MIRPSRGKTLYILDEPTTGLHFYDIEKLLSILHELVNQNNTVIVIEHNMDFVKTADWIIDLGPKGGFDGGKIIFEGPIDKIVKTKNNTGIALKKTLLKSKYKSKKTISEKKYPQNLIIENANENNLKNVSIQIPHGKITAFTGPSGSGKTSLAFDTIVLATQLCVYRTTNVKGDSRWVRSEKLGKALAELIKFSIALIPVNKRKSSFGNEPCLMKRGA